MMELKHDWTFVCEQCRRVLEKDMSPFDDNMNRVYSTECCDKYMQRVFPNHKQFHILGAPYIRTKYSDSLAVSISQIEEHKKMHPDVKIDAQGRPGFDTVQQQDRYLDAIGMRKDPQKIRKLKQLT